MKEEIKEKLQRVLDRAVEEKELAGGSVLVLKGGQEVCYAESGMADREEKGLWPETPFTGFIL